MRQKGHSTPCDVSPKICEVSHRFGVICEISHVFTAVKSRMDSLRSETGHF